MFLCGVFFIFRFFLEELLLEDAEDQEVLVPVEEKENLVFATRAVRHDQDFFVVLLFFERKKKQERIRTELKESRRITVWPSAEAPAQ